MNKSNKTPASKPAKSAKKVTSKQAAPQPKPLRAMMATSGPNAPTDQ